MWQEIIRDINYLRRFGIEIDGKPNLKGTLTHTSFDNLGANIVLGFVASFSGSHYCRHCMQSKQQCQETVEEQNSSLRTKENYNEHWQIIQNSEKVDYKQTKGMKMHCKLNDIMDFHILDNPSVDIMHDLAEGVVPFFLEKIFSNAIKNVYLKNQN